MSQLLMFHSLEKSLRIEGHIGRSIGLIDKVIKEMLDLSENGNNVLIFIFSRCSLDDVADGVVIKEGKY